MSIKFINDEYPYNIMIKSDRYIICSRWYTIKESELEAENWDLEFDEYCKNHIANSDNYDNIEDFQYTKEYYRVKVNFERYEQGERPEEVSEDTQCYTIIDLKNKIRGADNYYNKFNYLNYDECITALDELESGEMEISRRNRIDLDIEYILN